MFEELKMDATLEMANAAAKTANIKALDAIIAQGPSIFPSSKAIQAGLGSLGVQRELLAWVLERRPESLPDQESLEKLGY
jgi:hypothetical protein